MTIRPFQAVYPNTDYIASSDSFFETVKSQFLEYRKTGFFEKTSQESVYIYQIQTKKRTYTGLIACSDINEYIDGNIKKHENTLAAKEQEQMYLLMSRKAVVKPVLLIYPKVKKIDTLIADYIKNKKSFYEIYFDADEQNHVFWEVNNGELIEKIQKLFSTKVPVTYIADGHHRCSSTSLLYSRTKKKNKENPYQNLLSAFFPIEELEIHDYNRIVDGLSEISGTQFMAKLSQLFEIEILEKESKPKQKHEITMFLNKEWFSLKWKTSILKKYKKENIVLDAKLLDIEVLKNILGIKDVKTDTRIKYLEGPRSLAELKSKTLKVETRVAFCLYPTEMSDLISTADADGIMPPKSTWFEPRLKNGLIVQEVLI